MGLANNVDVKTIEDKTILDAPATLLTADVTTAGSVAGTGSVLVVKHNGALNLVTLRYRLKDVAIKGAKASFKAGSEDYPGRLVHHPGVGSCASGDRKARAGRDGPCLGAGCGDKRRRSAAHRDLHDLVEHRESRLGAAGVRSLRDPLRSHPQGSREAGQPAREVRRHRHAAPGQQRQEHRLRTAEAVQAAAVQEERSVQELWLLHRDRRCPRRHGARGCGRIPEVRRRRRHADDLRHRQRVPGRVRHRQGR